MLRRKIDSEGYVTCGQHFSHAMDDGWPFPLFPQMFGDFEGKTFGYLFQDGPDKVEGMIGYWKDDLFRKGHMGERAAARWKISGLSSEGIVSDT